MKLIQDTEKLYIPEPTVVTLGKFDGFHRGHQKLLRDILIGEKDGLASVVMSFDFSCLAKTPKPVLMTGREKISYLERLGIDYYIQLPFTKEVSEIQAETFVNDILLGQLHAKRIVCGTDFCFGYQRKGTVELLQNLSEKMGFELVVEEKEWEAGKEISSTLIRSEVLAGNMETAACLLGRSYDFDGEVIHGMKLGRTIGFPTLNLIPEEGKIIPPYGVYFSRVSMKQGTYYGITNIGVKPTVSSENKVIIETYLLDGTGDFYGEHINVELLSFTRPEKKFTGLDALKCQIEKDLDEGRRKMNSCKNQNS